jgi:DNA-binding NtrC family response regulator
VDDEPDILRSLAIGLKRKNLAIETFQDPLEAISKFQANKYTLGIIDMRMPHMDGIDLSSKLLKIDPKLKVCFLTAFEFVHEEIKKQFAELSQSYFMKKPVSLKELDKIVRSILVVQ